MNNFKLVNADTDSISFCKSDQSPFSEIEQENLLNEINSIFPEHIKFSHDGYFEKIIILKAKNYVLWDGEKIKTKGSAIRSSTREPALKNLIDEIIETIITEKFNYVDIYHKYIKKCTAIKTIDDMKPWTSRKTVTQKVLNAERTNEQKILDAIDEETVQEGDKIQVYFKEDKSLCLIENFDGNYDQFKLMEKVWKTMCIFEEILDIKQFTKYHLKTRRKFLENI